MKLELKHVLPYLAYDLKGIATDINLVEKITVHNVTHCLFEQEKVKLLLTPLSELTKEDWVEVFKAGDVDCEIGCITELRISDNIYRLLTDYGAFRYYGDINEFDTDRPFNQLLAFNKLYELHADVENLIGQGLALNKNQVK